jgi:gliding motility-associated-like protein
MLRKAVFFVAALLIAFLGHGQIASTFDANTQGWTAPDANAGIVHSLVSGNPGGFVLGRPFVIVLGATTLYFPFYFVAPTVYYGNRSTYYNGTLRYDIQQSTTGAPNQYAEVAIFNSSVDTLYYFPTVSNQPPAAPAWDTYSVVLNNAMGFWKTSNSPVGSIASEVLMQSVLANLTRLEIRGLYRDANTINRLDNVSFSPPIVVTAQPTSTAVCNTGVTSTFATTAIGNPAIAYRWQFESSPSVWTNLNNGGGYSNVATNTLSVNTTGNFGAGNYRCRISGTGVVDAFTNVAVLTINALPGSPLTSGAISCPPASVILSATGGTNGQYRWYTASVGGSPIAGQSNSTFTTPLLSTNTTYYVAITNGTCESTRTPVTATIATPGCDNVPPVITAAPLVTQIEGIVSLNLVALISDGNNNSDLSTLRIVTPPASGARVIIDGNYNLIIDYASVSFSGTENITIEVCDPFSCSQQTFSIDVVGDIIFFDAISANGDLQNSRFFIEYITALSGTRENIVSIYNRWGDLVWEGINYDNENVVFEGQSNSNSELPSGVYFYKVTFASERAAKTGYLTLKR